MLHDQFSYVVGDSSQFGETFRHCVSIVLDEEEEVKRKNGKISEIGTPIFAEGT